MSSELPKLSYEDGKSSKYETLICFVFLDQLQHFAGFAFSTFDEKIFVENERMEEALDYLEEKKKISFEDSRTVESNLFWRKNQLGDYTDCKYWSLNKILNNDYWDLKRRIEEIRDKNIKKYQ